MRGVTFNFTLVSGITHISTHTPHAGRDGLLARHAVGVRISTHTPHAGRDVCGRRCKGHYHYFNSHAPCGA